MSNRKLRIIRITILFLGLSLLVPMPFNAGLVGGYVPLFFAAQGLFFMALYGGLLFASIFVAEFVGLVLFNLFIAWVIEKIISKLPKKHDWMVWLYVAIFIGIMVAIYFYTGGGKAYA